MDVDEQMVFQQSDGPSYSALTMTFGTSIDDNSESDGFVIKMCGLGFDAKKKDIGALFSKLKVKPSKIHFVQDQLGRICREGFVEFGSQSDLESAMTTHRHKIGKNNIVLYRSSTAELQRALEPKILPTITAKPKIITFVKETTGKTPLQFGFSWHRKGARPLQRVIMRFADPKDASKCAKKLRGEKIDGVPFTVQQDNGRRFPPWAAFTECISISGLPVTVTQRQIVVHLRRCADVKIKTSNVFIHYSDPKRAKETNSEGEAMALVECKNNKQARRLIEHVTGTECGGKVVWAALDDLGRGRYCTLKLTFKCIDPETSAFKYEDLSIMLHSLSTSKFDDGEIPPFHLMKIYGRKFSKSDNLSTLLQFANPEDAAVAGNQLNGKLWNGNRITVCWKPTNPMRWKGLKVKCWCSQKYGTCGVCSGGFNHGIPGNCARVESAIEPIKNNKIRMVTITKEKLYELKTSKSAMAIKPKIDMKAYMKVSGNSKLRKDMIKRARIMSKTRSGKKAISAAKKARLENRG